MLHLECCILHLARLHVAFGSFRFACGKLHLAFRILHIKLHLASCIFASFIFGLHLCIFKLHLCRLHLCIFAPLHLCMLRLAFFMLHLCTSGCSAVQRCNTAVAHVVAASVTALLPHASSALSASRCVALKSAAAATVQWRNAVHRVLTGSLRGTTHGVLRRVLAGYSLMRHLSAVRARSPGTAVEGVG
jgi:hypothetical protein